MSDNRQASPSIDKLQGRRTIKPAPDEHVDPIDVAVTAPRASKATTEQPAAAKRRLPKDAPKATVQLNARLDPDVRNRLVEISDIEGVTIKDALENAIMAYRPTPLGN